MIKEISWHEIETIWKEHLWPYRSSPIEERSAMMWKGGYNMINMIMSATYFGYFDGDKIVGVNSGHGCVSDTYQEPDYRSRGLWVDPDYRGQGIGQKLLKATIEKGFDLGNTLIWSYPRYTSWSTYKAVGFKLDSDWVETENGKNAYCSLKKKNKIGRPKKSIYLSNV